MRKSLLIALFALVCCLQTKAGVVEIMFDTWAPKYYESMEASTPPSGDWYAEDYDDSAWNDYTGTMNFPVGDAFWVRGAFNIVDNPASYTFYLQCAHDDRGDFYVNGNHVHGCGGCGRYRIHQIPSEYLKAGRNVIAAYTYDGGYGEQYLEFKVYAEGNDNVIMALPTETSMTLSGAKPHLYVVDNDNHNRAQLNAAIWSPEGKVDANFIWTSSDPIVASVDNGLVLALDNGTTTITATTTVEGKTYTKSCDIEVTAFAEGEHVIFVDEPGTLSSLISEEDREVWNNLTLFGDINGDDLAVIRYMAGRDWQNNVSPGMLARLDMFNTNIKGGQYKEGNSCGDNQFGQYIFSQCNSLKEIILPASLRNLEGFAFKDCINLENVTLNEGLTSISYQSFMSCTKLQSISIPASVTSIRYYVFRGCSSLKEVIFAENSRLSTIEYDAFNGCSALESIHIPASIVTLPLRLFSDCSKLGTVTFDEGSQLKTIGGSAFYNCNQLSQITLPASLTGIEESAFASCNSLNTVNFPSNSELTSIGNYAFRNTQISSINLPNTLINIGNCAFQYCYGLETVNIGTDSKMTTIGESAFDGTALRSFYVPKSVSRVDNIGLNNANLRTITVHEGNTWFSSLDGILYDKRKTKLLMVPQGFAGQFTTPSALTTIPAYAFSGCSNLRAVVLSDNVTTIEEYAFAGCAGIKVIHSLNPEPPVGLATAFDGLSKKTMPVFVPIGSLAAYQATCWNDFEQLSEYSATPSLWISDNNVNLYDTHFDETRIKDLLAVVLTPEGPSESAISWESSNPSVVTVENGVVTLVAPGNAQVTASAIVNGSSVTAVCDVIATGFEPGQNVYYVHAGNLSSLISEEEKYQLTNLTLFGSLNGDDIGFIREMCGASRGNCNDWSEKGALSSLDMSEARIVESGSRYMYGYWENGGNHTYYNTLNNAFSGGAFYNCRSLKEVKMPKTLVSLGTRTFYNCYNLESVVMPESLTELGEGTFYDCRNLTSIALNFNNIERYGENAFYNAKLEEIRLTSTKVPVLTGTSLINPDVCVVVVPASALSAYREADGWKNFYQQIVPDDAQLNITATVTEQKSTSGMRDAIGEEALSYVTHLTLKGSINSYDLMMMRNKMPNLHYLDLTETTVAANPYEYVTGCHTEVNRIGEKAFEGFAKLLEVKLPNSITYVGNSAFRDCNNLRSVTLYPGIVTIDGYAFSGCGSLTTIEIPESVAGINSFVFWGCGNLMDVIMHEGLLTVGSSAFQNCNQLENLSFPSTTTNIGSAAFHGCFSLKHVDLPKSLQGIERNSFTNCRSLLSIAIPSHVKYIGDDAFSYCSQLEELRIPPMLETIGNRSFNGCNTLKDIYVYIANARDIKIDQNTFNCWTTAMLHVPDFASNSYYWDTQWSQFVNITEFNEPYETFYTKNTMTLDSDTGTIDGDPDATLYENGGLIVDDVEQSLSDVELDHNGTDGASLIATGDGSIEVQNLTIDIKVAGYRWHFFCFPFDIALDNVSYEGEYVWRLYNGAARSRREGGWQDLPAGTTVLEKGRGYIFQGTVSGDLRLTIANPDLSGNDVNTSLEDHESESAQDAGWNFIGNPYTAYYEVTEDTYSAPITVWTGDHYEAYRPGDDDYSFAPYQAFFVQSSEDQSDVAFDADNRSSYTENQANMARARARRAARRAKPNRLLINLELMAEGNDSISIDKSRIVFNNSKSADYETNCDAAKFWSNMSAAEIYTIDGSGTCYSINERPVGEVTMGIKVVEEGTYSIRATRQDNAVLLIDHETGIAHDLSLGDYTFYAAKGDNAGRFSVKLNQEVTTIDSIKDKTGVEISTQGGITIGNVDDDVEVSLYNFGGVCVKSQKGAGTLDVPAGNYVLNIGATSLKVAVM